jgi:DNA-binding transcriptional LysR family regulator
MDNWDNIRFFLAVARSGSVRAAASVLGVNHSTVLRHVSQLEAQLGARLFEKLPSGYVLTPAGEEILELAGSMESLSSQLQAQIFARDQSLSGALRVAMPPSLATDLLMPDLAEFSCQHPAIELQIISSYDTVNLTRRQADVAIRLVYDQMTLPQHLIGTRLQDVYRGVYIASSLLDSLQSDDLSDIRWILKEEDGDAPDWAASQGPGSKRPPIIVNDLASQVAAAKAEMGATILTCFIGDEDPELVRVPGSVTEYYGTIWLLTLDETRKIKRVKVFSDFIKSRINALADVLAGRI